MERLFDQKDTDLESPLSTVCRGERLPGWRLEIGQSFSIDYKAEGYSPVLVLALRERSTTVGLVKWGKGLVWTSVKPDHS